MCIYCGSGLPAGKILFRDLCNDCGKELHICKHCKFYKPGAYRDCLETIPEAVKDKERMNFCEYFQPLNKLDMDSSAAEKSNAAKNNFDKLFN